MFTGRADPKVAIESCPKDFRVDKGNRGKGQREMKTAAAHTRVVLWLLGTAAGLMLATGGTNLGAAADYGYGRLDVLRKLLRRRSSAETSSTPSPQTAMGRPLHLLRGDRGVALPRGRARQGCNCSRRRHGPYLHRELQVSDSENIRAVRHGDVLVEMDTDFFRAVAHGSDGSRAFVTFHAHFTVNANGETTVEFETDQLVCT